MLTEIEKKQIEEELVKVPQKQAGCIDALRIVQQQRGWISDDSIQDIANYLEMSAEDVDSIATFYSLIFRKPVGRHVILICDSISCWITGYEQILNHIKNSLDIDVGETTADGRFTLLAIPCLGICDHAPALMIDNDLHLDLTEEKVSAILRQYN